MQRTMTQLATLAAAGILAACGSDDGGSNGPGTTPVVTFNLATRPATGTAPLMAIAEPYTITDGSGNTLTFDRVELVLREIELKRADRDVVCGEDDRDTDDDSNDDSDDDSSRDECEELEFGPVLLDLPLGAGAARAFTAQLAPGIYDKLEFEIHKPEDDGDDAADAAFLAQHPDFRDVSVRVTGSYNGTPFTYTSDLGEEQERALVPPLEIATAQAADLTLFIDIDGWFRTGAGTLLDPRTANDGQPNEDLVEDNIERSIDAFEDDDRDGEDDDDDDGSDDDDGTPDQGPGDR